TIASQPRYGRIRSRMKRDMLALFALTSGMDIAGAAPDEGAVAALTADGSGICTALPIGGAPGNRHAARDGSRRAAKRSILPQSAFARRGAATRASHGHAAARTRSDQAAARSRRGTAASSVRVYSCSGWKSTRSAGPASTSLPFFMTAMSWARYSTTPKLWVMKRYATP